MAKTARLYPPIEPYDLEPPQVPAGGGGGGEEKARSSDQLVMWDEEPDASPAPEAVIDHSQFDSSDTGFEFACPVDWNSFNMICS
jgi:hypothetical protein